jgi:ABC-2 type transport system permease protein
MWQRLLAMVIKELGQLLRDPPILFILVWAFTGAIFAAGNAMKIEVNNYPVLVYDLDRSALSRELISLLHPPRFNIVAHVGSDGEVIEWLDSGKAAMALIIPPGFQRAAGEGQARFQIIADGTISRTSLVAISYVARIAERLNLGLIERRWGPYERLTLTLPRVESRVRVAYNPNVENAWFGSLIELLNLTTMVSTLLTAAALVRERTHGTLEQLLVTPLRPFELFAAKIIPTVIVVLPAASVGLFGIVQGVFDTPIRGSLPLFYSVMAIYVAAASSLGLLIATYARTVAQAAMMLFLILFPMLFLSGAITPPESMAPWMRWLSLLSPLRYFIDFGYQVLFKGNGVEYVWHDIVGILVLGSLMFGAAVWRFRRLYE